MSKVVLTVPTMTGGVSQQPPALRLSSQCEESTNAIGTLVEGLKKRAPTIHLGNLLGAALGTQKHHTIDRDDAEKYHAILSYQTVKVWDINDLGISGSTPETVLNNAGSPATAPDFAYLTTDNPERDLQCLTVADYTLVVNKAIQVEMESTTSSSRKPESLVVVRQGNYSTLYVLSITVGATTTTVTYESFAANGIPPAGGAPDIPKAEESIRTTEIAEGLVAGLTNATIPAIFANRVSRTGGALSGFTVATQNSVIHLQRTDTTEFETSTDDTVGSTTLTLATDEVQLFSDLPITAPTGYKCKVAGEPGNSRIGYWVEFFPTNDADTFGEGLWRETVAPGVTYEIDKATLPHVLLRQADGNWRWTPLDGHSYILSGTTYTVPEWGDRVAGDGLSNADPSFVGETIRSLFFFKNRLGVLSREKITLSEVGEFFNFYRTTVVDILDSERIDVGAPHTKITELNHAVPMSEQLLLFSEHSQFVLRGDGPLTPTSVTIAPVSEYESLAGTPPVTLGESIMVPANRGSYSLLRELRDVSQNRPKFAAIELTAAVPTYVEGSIMAMAANAQESVLALVADADRSVLWIYSFFINGGERVQSAWQKFTLSDGAIIRSVSFLESKLYLAVERESEVSLETMDFEPFQTDDGQPLIHLDRRVSQDAVTMNYSPTAKQTTVTVPYQTHGETYEVYRTNGHRAGTVSQDGNDIVVKGDQTGQQLWIGVPYEMRYTFSEPVLRDHNNAPVASGGQVRLRMLSLLYESTGYFKLEVQPKVGAASYSVFTGIGVGRSLLDSLTSLSGRWRAGLMGKSEEITVTIINDSPFPSRFLSCDFEGHYLGRGGSRR